MKRKVLSCDEWKQRINDRLQASGQMIRVKIYTRDSITLSNGVVLSKNEARIFKRRITNVYDIWVKNMDLLLSGKITEQEIKSIQRAIGGKSCQRIHGEKIKQNLNKGTPWNKGTKGKYPYSYPCAEDTKRKISIANKGQRNGMYGKKHSDVSKQHKSKLMKQKILEGKFTPNSNNRNTHWNAYYNNKKYRSSWEAWYQYLNPNAEYEKVRILYEYLGKEQVYIVDFVDNTNKLVIEVKPSELTNTQLFKAKWEALNTWAITNGYKAVLVTKEWLKDNTANLDYSLFDRKTAEKIRKIYEAS